jgi:hypothetical protein
MMDLLRTVTVHSVSSVNANALLGGDERGSVDDGDDDSASTTSGIKTSPTLDAAVDPFEDQRYDSEPVRAKVARHDDITFTIAVNRTGIYKTKAWVMRLSIGGQFYDMALDVRSSSRNYTKKAESRYKLTKAHERSIQARENLSTARPDLLWRFSTACLTGAKHFKPMTIATCANPEEHYVLLCTVGPVSIYANPFKYQRSGNFEPAVCKVRRLVQSQATKASVLRKPQLTTHKDEYAMNACSIRNSENPERYAGC